MKVLFAEAHNLDRPDPVGSHHYIKLFKAAGFDALWLGPALSPYHLFKMDKLNRYRFRLWRQGLREIDGIKWLLPFTLAFYYNKPVLRSLFMGRHQFRFCLPPVSLKLRQAGFEKADLLWCAGPAALSLLDLVPHTLSCYRLADRLDKFSGIPENVGELQKELIKKVDFVLATSRDLFEWALKVRDEGVYYLPNGVSAHFFESKGELPEDFPKDGLPVAVYVGTLDSRFDLSTLSYAVKSMPEIHFLLIGPVTDSALEEGLRALKKEANFTMLGAKPYSALPAYLKRAKAGLIPFKLNELTAAVNPIKYYEYLACGLPAVAPMMRELKEAKSPVLLYKDKEEFCQQVRAAVNTGEEGRANLKEIAHKNTWQARYLEIEKIIEEAKFKKTSVS